MPSYDGKNAQCFVFTYKEGLLSPIAHDLRLVLKVFAIHVTDSIVATFDTASLEVDTALKEGSDHPGALSAADKAKIAQQIREDVLHSVKYPQASFRSSAVMQRADGGYDLRGELNLHGVTQSISAQTHLVEHRQRLALTLHQPDFGIAPYRAMLGTLKIHPDVRVELFV